MIILQLNPTISVSTPLGDGDAYFLIDYGCNTNSMWVVRFAGGITKNLWSDDIKIYGNPADGKGWDVEPFDVVKKIPAGAKRNTDFIKK